MPLGRVFWGYGVLAGSALVVLAALAWLQAHWLTCQLLLLAGGLHTVWLVVSLWRCAAAADPFWGTFARYLAVAWALNASMVLIFAQIELLTIWL